MMIGTSYFRRSSTTTTHLAIRQISIHHIIYSSEGCQMYQVTSIYRDHRQLQALRNMPISADFKIHYTELGSNHEKMRIKLEVVRRKTTIRRQEPNSSLNHNNGSGFGFPGES